MADTRYASRKFLLAVAAFVAGAAFFALGKLTAAEWSDFTRWALAMYLAANVSDQAVTK